MSGPDRDRDDDGSVDVEAAWADIIAHWDETGTPPLPRCNAEDVPDDQATPPAGPPGDTRGAADHVTSAPDDVSVVRDDPAVDPGQGDSAPGDEEPVEDGWQDDWEAPRSRVGGDAVRDAAEHEAELDEILDDEGYDPPDPPPLPRGDVVSRLAWGGLLGAPLFFLLAALFWHSAPTWLVAAAVCAFVAGFVTLVVRMPDSRDDDDDGAVV